MTSLILEQSAIEKLRAVKGGVEVRDQQGNLVGYFHPALAPADVDPYECPLGEEELLRRSRQGGGRRLADILDDLKEPS